MKKLILTFLLFHTSFLFLGSSFNSVSAQKLIKPTDKNIQYIGRVSFKNPEAPAWNYTGTTFRLNFSGSSLKMICKPESGYFMVSIDKSEAFKVAYTGKNDSIATLATALPQGNHSAEIMYCIEGHDNKPELRGFILDNGAQTLAPTPLPQKKIEFIGNSITCAYGVEDTNPNNHFDIATENHYLSYAAITARRLGAMHYSVSRSGIGIYRHYGSSIKGSDVCMPNEYEYTKLYDHSEKWDFTRYQPDIVCVNLGTNDTSPDLETPVSNSQDYNPNAKRGMGCDKKLLTAGYRTFLRMLRNHYPTAKIVFLCGSMLNGEGLELISSTLDKIVKEANAAGDKSVYRFNFTPQTGSLGYGADWHPSIAQQQLMADELTPYIKDLMNW